MKIAFITQPWDGIGPGSSLGILTCQTALKLAEQCKVYIYTKNGRCAEINNRIEYKYVSLKPDGYLIKLMKVFEKLQFIGLKQKPLFSLTIFYLLYSMLIAKNLKKDKIEIVHIHNYSQFVNVIRFFNPNIKIVLHMHCEWLTQLNYNMINKRLAKCDLVIGCSDYITNKISNRFSIYSAKCKTLYNGVDPNVFFPPSEKEEEEDAEIRILFVGRVSPEKGLHDLIESFNSIAKDRTDLHLDIVGPIKTVPFNFIIGLSKDEKVKKLSSFYKAGDYQEYLLSMLSDSVRERVKFHGQKNAAELSEFYTNADISVNPSYTEAFGMSVIEAMSSGVPVVAARVGGMVEIIETSQAGYLFEAGDSKELTKKLNELITNAEVRNSLGKNGRANVQQKYSWESIAEKLFNYYKEII